MAASNPILLIDPEALAITAMITSGGSQAAAWTGLDKLLLLGYTGDEYDGAVAVIDQSTASVTATFPLSGAPINFGSARTNHVSTYVPNSGAIAPSALADRQIFGDIDGILPNYIDLESGTAGSLPLPTQPDCYYSEGTGRPGASPPDGKNFLVRLLPWCWLRH